MPTFAPEPKSRQDTGAARIVSPGWPRSRTAAPDVAGGVTASSAAAWDFSQIPVHASARDRGLAKPGAGLPVSGEPEGRTLRIADVWYSDNGTPLDTPLSAADKARLGDLLAELEKDDPAFYAVIRNEDIVVALASLPKGKDSRNIGRSHIGSDKRPVEKSEMHWFLFDHSKLDPLQGIPKSGSTEYEAWLNAVEAFNAEFPEEKRQAMMATKKTRGLSQASSGYILLDLVQIDQLREIYKNELDAFKALPLEKQFGINKPVPQSAMGTLRHEAGHIVFTRTIEYNQLGQQLPAAALPAALQTQVATGSADTAITADVALYSEYAAETVDDPLAGKPGGPEKFAAFDLEKFKEENDPRFGIGGYHDLDGATQTPAGYGVRMKKELTLIGAKAVVRALQKTGKPVFLSTVLKTATEQRLFDVLMLMGKTEESVEDEFDRFKTDHLALAPAKREIVKYTP